MTSDSLEIDDDSEFIRAKRLIDQETQKQFEEQHKKHTDELKAIKRATDEKIKKEMENVAEIRKKQSQGLAELKSNIDECIKAKLREHAAEGRRKIIAAQEELKLKQDGLKEKSRKKERLMNEVSLLKAEIENRRQQLLTELDIKNDENRKNHQDQLLNLQTKFHEKRIEMIEKQKEVVEENMKQIMERDDDGNRRKMGDLEDAHKLQIMIGKNDKLLVFQQSCNRLKVINKKLGKEYSDMYQTFIDKQNNQTPGKSSGNLKEVLSSLRQMRDAASNLSSDEAPDDFELKIKQLLKLIDSQTTNLNKILAAVEEEDQPLEAFGDLLEVENNMEQLTELVKKITEFPLQNTEIFQLENASTFEIEQ